MLPWRLSEDSIALSATSKGIKKAWAATAQAAAPSRGRNIILV